MHIEDTTVMYGIYNAETLEKLIKQFMAYIKPRLCKNNYLQEN